MADNLINRPGIAVGLPVTPVPKIDPYNNPVPEKTIAETWMEALNRTKSGRVQDIPLSSVYLGERYTETMPGTDYEEAAAQQQPWSSKAANSLGKMGVLATTTFLQNTIGAVNGLVNWANTGDFTSFYNNDFNKWVNDVNETLEDKWANYYTAAERDAEWYSRRKLLSANFFWDGIIKNLGFSLGTIASGALFAGGMGALSKALGGIPKAAKLFSMGKAAETLAATEEALSTAAASGRAAATYGQLTKLSNKFLGQYNLLNPASQLAVAGLSTSGESAFEAYHNMNEYRNQKIQEYKDSHYGMNPTGADLDRINRDSESVGDWSYRFNMALLSFTNYVQFPKIFGSSYTAEKGIANALTHKIKDITKEGGKYVVAPSRGGKILSTLNKIRPYTFSASEAFEEGSQFAITKGTQDYYDKKYNNIPNTFFQSIMEGVSETIGTNEGMENVLIGGLSGALMLGAGKYREARELSRATQAALSEGGRWTPDAGINTAGFSEFTKDTYDSTKRASLLQQQRDKAIIDGNIIDSKDLEADYIINYLTPRIKYGRFDLVREDINDYKILASTEEGFAQLQQEGKALETDTRESFLARINNLEQTANDVKTFYQTLNLRYAGLTDDNGNRIYSPEVIDKMIYASVKIADYDRRIPSLSLKLTERGIDTETIITDLIAGEVESFNKAVDSIYAIKNLTDDQKLDLGQALDDVAEMGLRRNKFLQEYSDIKNNPEKYKEQRIEDIPKTPEGEEKPTVIIKTKTGEKNFEVGTEYFLGKVVEYDKSGNEVYRAPRLTIIGENEDGTVKIKDSNGKVRDVSKSVFEDYKLARVDKTLSDKKAKFFMDHWNTIFEFNFGKGRKRKGRLQWEDVEGKLLFTFKDDKGKIKSIEVTGDQFVPRKGYDVPMIRAIGELTPVQKKSLDDFTKEKDKRTAAKREARLGILNELFDEVSKKQSDIETLISKKNAELVNIQKEIDTLTKQIEQPQEPDKRAKEFHFRPTTRKALDAAMRLSRMKDQIEKEISNLESEREETEFAMSYIVDMSEDIDMFPTDSKEFIEELNDQIINLEILQEETAKQIGVLSGIIGHIDRAIEKAVNFLSDLVNDFVKRYPKVPRVMGQEWIDFLKANPNFLKNKPNYRDDLATLDNIIAQIEDSTIKPSEEKVKELLDNINTLKDEMDKVERDIKAKTEILKRFEKIALEYEQKKAQEERLKDDKLIKEALGTASKGNVPTKNTDRDEKYEPSFKKSIEHIWRATIVPTRLSKPHQIRANKFGFNLNKFENRDGIRGVYVTSKNDSLIAKGLIDYIMANTEGDIDRDSIIALVMVDISTGTPVLVNENGQPIAEGEDVLDNIIFQVFPEADLRWKMKGAEGETMFRKTDASREEEVRKQYAELRTSIINASEEQTSVDDLSVHEIEASFGHPRFKERVDDRGNFIKGEIDYDVRTPVTKAGLITEDDFYLKPVILIPTTNEIVDLGTTHYEGDNLGRPFLETPNGVIPLQNRHHTRKEAETIFDVILQVAKNMIDPELGAKHSKTVRFYEWLETVVYWGVPTTREGEVKKSAYNSVFWEKNKDGDFVLYLSGKGTNFPFTPTGLTENKGAIIDMLEKMYNNVNVANMRKINEPYKEIISIDQNGEPVTREWVNYQAYLLSDKMLTTDESNKDNNKPRTDIPLTTILSPLENENDVNRTGIYFYTTDNPNEIEIPELKRTSMKTRSSEKAKPEPTDTIVRDGKTPNVIIGAKDRRIVFTVDEKGEITVLPQGDVKVILEEMRENVRIRWTKEGKIKDDEFVIGEDEKIDAQAKADIKDIIRKRIDQEPEIKKEETKEEKPVEEETPSREDVFVIGEDDDTDVDINELFNEGENESDEEERKYRLARTKQNDKFEKEDWPKVEKWLKANFPNLPVYRVKNIIQATNGETAWGMFHDAALYVYENAEAGTVYHEVFEAVWKMFTSPEEQVSIINEFKQRKGTFIDRPSGRTIKYSDATPSQIKEQLAEEFRDYVYYKKIPPKPDKGRPFIVKLFADIVRFIKNLFYGKDYDSLVEEMFRNISRGKYKNVVPYQTQLSLANRGIIDVDEAFAKSDSELRLAKIGDTQRRELLDSMTYYMLFDLIKDDKSIFNLTDKKQKKSNVYGALKERIIKDIAKKSRLDRVGVSEDQSKIIRNSALNFAKLVNSQWGNLVAKHEEYLRRYEIEFDENDNIALSESEYEKSKDDAYGEANKIDHLKKSNPAIKLLLATMIEMDEDNNHKLSSVGGPILIPMSRTAVSLYNNLHNSRTVDEMVYKLREMAIKDPNYRGLYKRLIKKDYTDKLLKNGNEHHIDLSQVKHEHSMRLLSAFYTLFRKQNPQVLTVTIFDNGEIAVGDTHLSTFAAQIREDYISDIVAKIREGTSLFVYDEKKKRFVGNPLAVQKIRLDNLPAMVDFLDKLGISFKLNQIKTLKGKSLSMFKDAVAGIRESIINREEIASISGKVLSINKRLMQLAYIQAQLNNPDFDSTFFNVDNERTQSFIGTNPVSDLYDFLTQIDKFDDVNLKGTQYEYLLSDTFSRGSSILKRMFSKGVRKSTDESDNLLRVVYVSGTDNQHKGKTKQSSKLNYKERLVQEINLNLEGYYLNLVPGDASMEWAIYMGNPVSMKNIREDKSMLFSIFQDYFIDEFNLAKEDRESSMAVISGKRRNTKEMRFFKSILGDSLHNEILKDKRSAEEVYEAYKSKIDKAIEKYVNDLNNKTKEQLLNYGILNSTDEGYVFDNVSIKENLTEDELNVYLTYMNSNYMIANIELHKLLYSDPYQYSDELKRIKLFLSPRQTLINNSPNMNAAFDRIWNRHFKKSDPGWINFTQDYFRSATHEDVWSFTENLEGYEDLYRETDGGGVISFPAYRHFRIRIGDWNDKEESQYRYDMVFEKNSKGVKLTDEEQSILDKGNPRVRSAYTPLKPVVAGNKGNKNPYNDIVIDKFALYPISMRLLTDINKAGNKKDSNAISLYNKMIDEKIDYIVFESSRKVGVTGMHSNYNENGGINNTPYSENAIINIPFAIMSVQTEVPSKDTPLVPRGSQITKLATMDYMEAGVPVDFETKGDITKRYKEWNKLSEDDKKEKSPLYKSIKYNQQLLEASVAVGYRNLLNRLGIRETYNERKGLYEYSITDMSQAAQTLRDEVLKREANDNISDALNAFEEGKSLIEATPAYHQIRNILYSIADKEVVSQKVRGGIKVQIPSSFLEEVRARKADINGKEGYVSDILGFYEKDGKQVCEIMIGRWFNSSMSDEELLKYLNETDEGKKILAGVAFRIPTQKQNSIESFVIKQFLPEEFGDSVIIPSAIVRKTGSDFDIDKLFIYLKNVISGISIKPKLISLKTDENSTARERYADWVLNVTNKDIKKYAKFLSRDEIKKIRDKYEPEFKRINRLYSDLVDEVRYAAYDELLQSYEDIDMDGTDQDVYVSDLFVRGKAIFKALPDYIKDEFFMVRDWIDNNNISGPDEVVQYLTLAEDMLESGEFDLSKTILEDLVSVYNEELIALGASVESIKEAKDNALVEYRENKSGAIRGIGESISMERKSILSARHKEMKDFYTNDYIDELVRIKELMGFEQFSKLDILYQNGREALENEYVQSLQDIVSHSSNFKRLTTPNSAKQLEELSKKIAKKVIGDIFDYTNPANMLDRTFMSRLRHAFVIGKYAIGIAAVNQTNHSLNQRQLIYIDPNRLKDAPEEDQYWLGDCRIKFDKFNKIYVDGVGDVATLSMIKNAAGQDISDIVSQFIDGYVDISKGPWIMELGATPNVVSTWLFLVKIGVPIDTVAYFMNQPIIHDYLRSIENAGYSWLFMDNFVSDMKDTYQPKSLSGVKEDVIPSKTQLEALVGKSVNELNDRQKEQQQFILDEFLKYAKMATHMFYVTQGSNFDTANFNDPFLVYKKFKQLEKAQQTVISNVDDILANSFVGKLGQTIKDIRNGLAQFLKSDQGILRNIIQQVLEPYVDMNDRDFVKIARKVVSDVFDYAVQVDKGLNKDIQKILIEKGGVATEMKKFIESITKDASHPLFNNHIVGRDGILKPILSQKPGFTGVNNIKVRGLQNKAYDQNNIIYAFREIRDYLKGKTKLYDRIVSLAVLQSGLSTSSISFTSVLPYEDFADIYQSTIAKIETIPAIKDFVKLSVFQRNNWNNNNIVPYMRARFVETKNGWKYNPSMEFLPNRIKAKVKQGIIPPVMNVWSKTREANSEHIVFTWEKYDELYTDENIKKYGKGFKKNDLIKKVKSEMRKIGDYSYINKGLFEKVRDNEGNVLTSTYINKRGEEVIQYVYKAINAWGDGHRANEFYDVAKQSVIDNGFVKVEEVSDKKIIDVFSGEKINKKATEKITAVDTIVSSKITFSEDQSYGYKERTIKNASADATIALAVDFNSAGEKLTKSSVLNQRKKYIPRDINDMFDFKDPFKPELGYELNDTKIWDMANGIVQDLNQVKAKTLNIAGNGIYTMKGKYTQKQLDEAVERLLEYVLYSDELENQIESVRTGGQTGIDEAGAKAAIKLGFPTTILAPKGWKFRNINGQDISSEKSFKDRFAVIGGEKVQQKATEKKVATLPRNAPPGFPETKRPDKYC